MRIGLLDHMGYGNLGDAATQDALIANIRARLPDASIVGFSLNPNDTRKRHSIDSYSITHWHPGLDQPNQSGTAGNDQRPRFRTILKKIPVFSAVVSRVLNLGRELVHLWRSYKAVKSLDVLIISGGGQLSELWRGPWSHPYNVMKFSVLTKLANRRLIFLNVGAGPLKSVLGRAFVRYSIHLADYVSFRDIQSQTLVRDLGTKRRTHVYVDSVYALNISQYEAASDEKSSRPLVGINPIGFCDPRIWPRQDVSAYRRYLDCLAELSLWLLNHNYRVRIFTGEASVDVYAIDDLKDKLQKALASPDISEMFVTPIVTVDELLTELSQFDFVVTSKFHGVVFSHLLAKPVIALSYHNKIDDLMQKTGHGEYCLPIENVNSVCLEQTFVSLVGNAENLKTRFHQSTHSNRELLKAQFDELFAPTNPHVQSGASEIENDEEIAAISM